MTTRFSVQKFFLSKLERGMQDILDLRCDCPWVFSEESEAEIDKAIAAKDGDRLIELHNALELESGIDDQELNQ